MELAQFPLRHYPEAADDHWAAGWRVSRPAVMVTADSSLARNVRMVSTVARRAGARYLLSEDFHAERRYDEVQILNPFGHPASEFGWQVLLRRDWENQRPRASRRESLSSMAETQKISFSPN